MIRYFFSVLTFFLFVRLVPLVWRGVAVGVAVAVTLPLPTLILPSLAHLHPGLVDAEKSSLVVNIFYRVIVFL